MVSKRVVCVTALLCSSHLLAEVDTPIPYDVTLPSGYSEGAYDGKSAYDRRRRGSFDSEPMHEVVFKDKPSDLPPPTVIAPSPLPIVREFAAGKVFTKKDLKGEDAVFQRIIDDVENDRCVLDPELCSPLMILSESDGERRDTQSKPLPRRQFLPSDAE